MSPFDNHPDELISASLTGDLTAAERRELDAHLDACATCRETLDAFRMQRQLLSGLAQPPLPRDLGARVRGGIDSGRFGRPWWRRPATFLAGFASLATVGAAALLVIFLTNRVNGPDVGHLSPTPSPTPETSTEATPSASPASPAPSATAAPIPLGMQPGDLVYVQVTGPYDALKLSLIDAQSGEKLAIHDPTGSQFGRVERATLSPDGRMLAFADNPGLQGVWRVFVANLADGSVQQLAETVPVQFGKRLAWSPDGRYLAFTVAPIGGNGSSDVWLYDRVAGRAARLTQAGNAYAASWTAADGAGNEQLWVSFGEANPVSQLAQFPTNGGLPANDPLAQETTTVAGFLPLVAPDAGHVLYWTGTMMEDGIGGWVFARGGMPQVAPYDPAPAGGSWNGTSLFSDLVVAQGGEAFSHGELAWAGDSDTYAFWGGVWTGTPEGDNYPDANAVYVSRVSDGALSQASALALGSLASGNQGDAVVNDVHLSPDGGQAVVTLAIPLPGDLVAPQSWLRVVPIAGGSPTDVGSGGASPPPWSGPGIVVPGSVAP